MNKSYLIKALVLWVSGMLLMFKGGTFIAFIGGVLLLFSFIIFLDA